MMKLLCTGSKPYSKRVFMGKLRNTQNTIFKLIIIKHETFVFVFVGITLMFLPESCQGDRIMVGAGGR
jgi:hypothetical protein